MATTVSAMGELRDLEPLSKQLNAATDELNVAITAIQNGLNGLGLGVEAWMNEPLLTPRVAEDAGKSRVLEEFELGYAKHGASHWALMVRCCHYRQHRDSSGDWEYVEPIIPVVLDVDPLTQGSRAMRVAAVAQIPKLIDRLKEQAKEIIDAVEQAKKLAKSLS